MDDEVKRPLSVWLTQALFLIVILQFAIAGLFVIFFCFSKGEANCFSRSRITDLVGAFGILLLMTLAFWALQRRKQSGRWLGAIILVAAMLVGMARNHYFQLFYGAIVEGRPLPIPPYECWKQSLANIEQTSCGYSSYLDLALRGVLGILFPQILLGLLASRLIYSHAVKRFFDQQ